MIRMEIHPFLENVWDHWIELPRQGMRSSIAMLGVRQTRSHTKWISTCLRRMFAYSVCRDSGLLLHFSGALVVDSTSIARTTAIVPTSIAILFTLPTVLGRTGWISAE